MKKMELIAPCHFGLEAVLKKEIIDLGYDITESVDGRITFAGDSDAVCRANIGLRTAERILIKIGSFHAESFEELFQGVKALPWEAYLPKDAAFPVKGYCLNSQLMSVPDCQKIIKKAVVERLKSKYRLSWFPETGETVQIRFTILKDQVSLCVDSSGEGLHKRGYRTDGGFAPLRETTAAALLQLMMWRRKTPLHDPFCGSYHPERYKQDRQY